MQRGREGEEAILDYNTFFTQPTFLHTFFISPTSLRTSFKSPTYVQLSLLALHFTYFLYKCRIYQAADNRRDEVKLQITVGSQTYQET